jgi:hypothetical protein
MFRTSDARRRWFGLLFLILAAGMTTWGLTLLEKHLRGWGFVIYWLVCLGLLLCAMAIAMLDFLVIRHRQRQERAALTKKALRETAAAIQARKTADRRPATTRPGKAQRRAASSSTASDKRSTRPARR